MQYTRCMWQYPNFNNDLNALNNRKGLLCLEPFQRGSMFTPSYKPSPHPSPSHLFLPPSSLTICFHSPIRWAMPISWVLLWSMVVLSTFTRSVRCCLMTRWLGRSGSPRSLNLCELRHMVHRCTHYPYMGLVLWQLAIVLLKHARDSCCIHC